MLLTNQDIEINKNTYLNLLRSTNKENIEDLIYWLETQTDIFYAPFNQYATPGSLVEHAINLCKQAMIIYNENYHGTNVARESENDLTIEEVKFVALTLDISKIGCYVPVVKSAKDENGWYQYNSYEYNDNIPINPCDKSYLFLRERNLDLTNNEVVGLIRGRDFGNEHSFRNDIEKMSFYKALREYPIVSIINMADIFATVYMDRRDEQKTMMRIMTI